MAIDIKSKEFADAWRIVSETLLAHLQSGELDTSFLEQKSNSKSSKMQSTPSSTSVKSCSIQDVRYAACPVRQTDGTYTFKNLKVCFSDFSSCLPGQPTLIAEGCNLS